MSTFDTDKAFAEIVGQLVRIVNGTIAKAADEGAPAAIEFLAGQIADCDGMTDEVEADYLRWRSRPDCTVESGLWIITGRVPDA